MNPFENKYMKQITIGITSCGRFQSLEKTVKSMEQTIDLSLYKKILTEDSKDINHINKIKQANKQWFLQGWKIIYTSGSGQKDLYKCHYHALKSLYESIETKYVFHCEDDQIFKKTNFDYFKLSYEILENNSNIWIVLLRDVFKDFWLKKDGIMRDRYYEILSDKETNFYWHEFIFLNPNESFSLQPWLRNTELMKKVMFGYEEYVNEKLVSERLSKLWYQSIVIKKWIYNHINPIFNSTKNIKNLWLLNFTYNFLKWTIKYRWWLFLKFIKNVYKNEK